MEAVDTGDEKRRLAGFCASESVTGGADWEAIDAEAGLLGDDDDDGNVAAAPALRKNTSVPLFGVKCANRRLAALAGVSVEDEDEDDNYARRRWFVRLQYTHLNTHGDDIFTISGSDYGNQFFIFSAGREANAKGSKILTTTIEGAIALGAGGLNMVPKKDIVIKGWKYDLGDCLVRIGNFLWPGMSDFHTLLEIENVGSRARDITGVNKVPFAEVASTLGFPAKVKRLHADVETLRSLNAGSRSRPGLEENIMQYVELMKNFFD